MGNPQKFLADSLANFADESASAPGVLAQARSNALAWFVTDAAAIADAALLIYCHRVRRAKRLAAR